MAQSNTDLDLPHVAQKSVLFCTRNNKMYFSMALKNKAVSTFTFVHLPECYEKANSQEPKIIIIQLLVSFTNYCFVYKWEFCKIKLIRKGCRDEEDVKHLSKF